MSAGATILELAPNTHGKGAFCGLAEATAGAPRAPLEVFHLSKAEFESGPIKPLQRILGTQEQADLIWLRTDAAVGTHECKSAFTIP